MLLDLPETTTLSHGDGLQLEDGHWILVRAAEEDLTEVCSGDAELLHRVAWHLGNRHCPADIGPDRIRIRRDHVIEEMLRGLGCSPVPVRTSFNPERGAYHHHQDHN